jgi:predicted RNA polymerase sigma factor
MVIALERWPADGVPDNPGAWLMTTAKRRAIDQVRRAKLAERTPARVGQLIQQHTSSEESHQHTAGGRIGMNPNPPFVRP